jgi:hypothetical protein
MGIESRVGPIGADRHDRRLLGLPWDKRTGLDAEDVEDVPGGIGHGVALEPADEPAAEPGRVTR